MNQPDEHGRTPLMYAVTSGWQHIVEFLLERGVDTGMVDDCHTTALMQGCSLGHPTIVRLLLDSGASVDDVCLVHTFSAAVPCQGAIEVDGHFQNFCREASGCSKKLFQVFAK